MILSIFAAIIGCVLTFVQMALIIFRGDGICFNEGCEIVDSLTLIPPFYFNLAGFLFFFFVLIAVNGAKKRSREWKRFAELLLLAGTAAEGVLFSFQLFITQTFCSYCLIIFALVLTANLFMGAKQMFKATVIFLSILLAFTSLDFRSRQCNEYASLDHGSIARFEVQSSKRTLYLLFSSTCVHCENVIEEIKQGVNCTVNFNPLDRIEDFRFPGAESISTYSTQTNLNFLRSLDLKGVPVLVDKHGGTTTIWRGERTIRTFLEMNCSGNEQNLSTEPIGQTSAAPPRLPSTDENCSAQDDCSNQALMPAGSEQQSSVN